MPQPIEEGPGDARKQVEVIPAGLEAREEGFGRWELFNGLEPVQFLEGEAYADCGQDVRAGHWAPLAPS